MFVDLQYVTRTSGLRDKQNSFVLLCCIFLSSEDGAIQIQSQSDTQSSSKTPFFYFITISVANRARTIISVRTRSLILSLTDWFS